MTHRILSALALAALTLCLAMSGAATGRMAEAQTQEPADAFVDLSVAIIVLDSASANRRVEIIVSNHGTLPAYDVEVEISTSIVDRDPPFFARVITIDTGEYFYSPNHYVEPSVWRIERVGPQTSYSGTFTPLLLGLVALHEWKASVRSATFESENRMQNNKAEAWQIASNPDAHKAEANYWLTSSASGLSTSTDGAQTANFVITVSRPLETTSNEKTLFGGYVSIELTPGLSANPTRNPPTFEVIDNTRTPVDPTPSNVSYSHNDNDNTGRFKIGFSDRHISFKMTLPVTVAAGAELNEQCLTAEVIAMPPAGPAPLDDPSDNSAKVCPWAPPTPLQSGEVSAFTLYPCVGVMTDPCDSNDDVRVRATFPNQDGYIMDSGTVVFHVQDHPLARAFDSHAGSVNSGDEVSWQTSCHGGTASCTGYHDTRTEFGVKLGWNRIPFNGHWRRAGPPPTGSWDGISLNVAARGKGAGTDPPGNMHLRSTASRNATYPLSESNGWSHTWRGDNPWKPSGDAASVTYQLAEFEEMGTYVVDYTLRAKHFSETGDCDTEIDADNNPDSFCGTETYIFHIGPMSDLGVADGGASPDVAADQYAITIAALNNGPDRALGAEVAVNLALPAGVTVAEHIASDGSYSNGKWDLGALRTEDYRRDYQRSLGEPDKAATLTLILEGENAADATATATATNVKDYTVCIGSDRSTLTHTNQSDCEADTAKGGSWHEGAVYDHIAGNNTATLTARRGTGGEGAGAPAAGYQRPRSLPAAIMVEWQPVPAVNGWAVSHYEIERSSSEWNELADNVACPADADNCQFVDIEAQPGQYYGYRVRAVNLPGVPGPWSRPMEIGRILTVGAPEAPVLTATPNEPHGDTQILLTWNKPVENGSAIIKYTHGGIGYAATGRLLGRAHRSTADAGRRMPPSLDPHGPAGPGTSRMHYRMQGHQRPGRQPVVQRG